MAVRMKNRKLAPWLMVVGYAAVVAVLSLLPTETGPTRGWDSGILPSAQKFGHMAVYAGFAVLLALASPAGRRLSGRGMLVVFVVCTAFGVAMEVCQSMSPGRTPSVFDAAINALGAAAGLLLAKAAQAYFRRRRAAAGAKAGPGNG
jgi:VanZ family protein